MIPSSRDPLFRWGKVTVALSLRQPWAWLIVNGYKDIENRSWPTTFRGPALIHAGQRWTAEEREHVSYIREVYRIALPGHFDRGGIVGGCEIVDCVTTSDSP